MEGMSKLPTYLKKYTDRSLPAHPCELLTDNVWQSVLLTILHQDCGWAASNKVIQVDVLYRYNPKTGEHRCQCGNTVPCSDLIYVVDFNPLHNHANLDAELLCHSECFTVKYEESVVLHAMVLSLYDIVYD